MQKGYLARFTRPTHAAIELVAVAYSQRSFPVHIHDQYVVGVVESGAERLDVNGSAHVIRKGDIITIDPGLAHANRTLGSEVLRYRVFYLPREIVARHAGGLSLQFNAPKRADASAAERLVELHQWFERAGGCRLEEERALAELVEIAFGAPTLQSLDIQLPEAIWRAQSFIDAHYSENFALDDVARAAGLSKFHLVRSFTRAFGLSPLAYRTQRRIHEAKRLVLTGAPLVDVASLLGFSDQSHLTRQFQSFVGISPARYREQ
ncbi:AraC family transcriptional regulator [Phenylobacterium sp. NIBR 498073]|uniref:helix-turn-helix transcriptional regulator n=1 Tax=Phenylobacterium sp. NIBR 498073 TaxID=3015177 RepID=UPI0022B2CB2D|nr:AraC family transcriptional regulator [Phenylobacterium sp. NIBR 498073]WGU40828.1 AraC family transcriptional regulator [Phenylobacterium sp. NIBR 498073]